MKRFTRLFATLLAASLAVTATAQDDPYAEADPTGQEIVFWHVHSGPNEELLERIVQDFNETNAYDITVRAENQGSYDELFQKMLPVLGTEDMPNLVLAYQNQAATYQLVDALVDLRPLVEGEAWGFSDEERADFFEGFVRSDVFPTFDDAQLGWPPNRSMEVLFFNRDWLAELGYDAIPTDPEAFREVVCAAAETPFSEARGDAAIGLEITTGASTFASWVFAFGGDVYDDESGRYSYDSPEAIEAMTYLQDLIQDGCATIEVERYGAQANFGVGTTFATTGSSVGIPYYERAVEEGADFAFDVAAVPHLTPDPVMNVYGASISVPDVGGPDAHVAAWLFLEHLSSPEAQAEWARTTNYFPVRESVAAELDGYLEENPQYATAFDLLEYGVAEPATPGYDFVRASLEDAMAAIFTGADVERTLRDVNEEANEILQDQLAELD